MATGLDRVKPGMTVTPDKSQSQLAELPTGKVKLPALSPAAELNALQGDWKVVRVEKSPVAGSSWPLFSVAFGTRSGTQSYGSRHGRPLTFFSTADVLLELQAGRAMGKRLSY